MRTIVVGLMTVLSGCATCQQHPVACSVAGAVVVGSLAASSSSTHERYVQARMGHHIH